MRVRSELQIHRKQNFKYNKGIRSCSKCSFWVTKVKRIENKVLKAIFYKKPYFKKANLSNLTESPDGV